MPLQQDTLNSTTSTVGTQTQQLLSIAINSGDTLYVNIVIVGTNDAGNALTQGLTALYTNIAGTITLVGFTKQSGITDSISKNWIVNAVADQPNNAVQVTVQGAGTDTIRWAVDGTYATLPLGV